VTISVMVSPQVSNTNRHIITGVYPQLTPQIPQGCGKQ